MSSKTTSWLDEKTQTPLIDQYARRLNTFVEALADGRIDEDEVKAQEGRVVALMREIEPKLSPELHAKVTELLCELTAYDVMQALNQMQASRPKSRFVG